MQTAVEPVAFVIRHTVKPGAQDGYETWLREIASRAATYPGHQGVHITRPADGLRDYLAVLRFASLEDAKRWIDSDERRNLVAAAQPLLEVPETVEMQSGIEFWFTPPPGVPRRAVAWKQWLITTSVIWPLSIVVPLVLENVFKAVPLLGLWGVRQGINAAVIVALVTYLIMPRYVRLISGWLFR